MKGLAKLCFEAGMLKKMQRTGYPFLGSGGESVADHSFRAALIGFWLAEGMEGVDSSRVALMMLHHDLAEARTGDLNYMNKRYCSCDEDKAVEHATREIEPNLAEKVRGLIDEFNRTETTEAKVARDADQLDLIVELKEQQDQGNPQAKYWIHYAFKRLELDESRELARTILETEWTEWWFEKREELWVIPNGKKD